MTWRCGSMGSTPTRFRQESGLTLMTLRKPKRHTDAKEARRRARERTGIPPVSRVIADKRRKPPKHKKSVLEDELQ